MIIIIGSYVMEHIRAWLQHDRREEEHIWPAAKIFANYLTHPDTKLEADVIVEVGAGTGLVSLCLGASAVAPCASESPMRIIATDCDSAALKNMKRNVHQNDLLQVVAVEEWNWLNATLPKWSASVDLMLASDVIYDNTNAYLHLSRQLAAILSRSQEDRRPPEALFMLQVRGEQGYCGSSVEAFINDVRERGLMVFELPLPAFTQNLCQVHRGFRVTRQAGRQTDRHTGRQIHVGA